MKRYILTGAPGAGKTAILRQLELDGFGVVEEAATDWIAVRQAAGIAEPWMEPDFVDAVARLQRLRLQRASGDVQFHDRSVICTVALAKYLGLAVSDFVAGQVERVRREGIFEPRVLFVRNLGFVEPTAARRISFEETLRFERMHEEIYREYGFETVFIEPGRLAERVAAVKRACRAQGLSPGRES